MQKKLFYKKVGLSQLDILTKISRSTFIDAFKNANHPEDFKRYIDEAFSEKQIESEILNPNSEFYFVYREDTLVSYFKLNEKEAQAEPFGKEALELSRIYILKPFQGQHLGTQILERIINIAKEKNKTWLWLGVWRHNPRAVQFYERHGFIKFDTHSFYIGNDKQTDWLMRLDIG